MAFALVSLLLLQRSTERSQLSAVIRGRGLSDRSRMPQPELAAAELLSNVNLATVIREAHFTRDDRQETSAEFIENVRSALRIDLGRPDEAGVTTIALRWTRENSASAARLLNVLARQFVSQMRSENVGAEESAYALAQQSSKDASLAVEQARQRLDFALAAMRRTASSPNTPTLAPPQAAIRKAAPPVVADAGRWRFLEQQLSDLEGRRATLGDRLMPEHPDMKAIDDKIATIRAQLAHQPTAGPQDEETVEFQPTPAPPRAQFQQDDEQVTRIGELGAELLDAQTKYESAAEHERVCWKALCASRSRAVIEVEPAVASAPVNTASWRMWLVATLCGVLCAGLTLACWPVPRVTFSTIEEVRSVTRLPVIVVGRGSLN